MKRTVITVLALLALLACGAAPAQEEATLIGVVQTDAGGMHFIDDELEGLVELQGMELDAYVNLTVIVSGELVEESGFRRLLVWDIQVLGEGARGMHHGPPRSLS